MAGIGTWSVDLATGALSWSDRVFQIHDMEPGPAPTVEEALAFYTREDAVLVEELLDRVIRLGERYDLVTQMYTATGRKIWVHGLAELESASDGTPIKLVGSFRDITEAKEAESRLRASEEQQKFALDGANEGLWDWDVANDRMYYCLLYTSPSPRDQRGSRMPSSA